MSLNDICFALFTVFFEYQLYIFLSSNSIACQGFSQLKLSIYARYAMAFTGTVQGNKEPKILTWLHPIICRKALPSGKIDGPKFARQRYRHCWQFLLFYTIKPRISNILFQLCFISLQVVWSWTEPKCVYALPCYLECSHTRSRVPVRPLSSPCCGRHALGPPTSATVQLGPTVVLGPSVSWTSATGDMEGQTDKRIACVECIGVEKRTSPNKHFVSTPLPARWRYNTVNFLKKISQRRTIARP